MEKPIKLTAVFVSLALVVTAPGLVSYEALAQVYSRNVVRTRLALLPASAKISATNTGLAALPIHFANPLQLFRRPIISNSTLSPRLGSAPARPAASLSLRRELAGPRVSSIRKERIASLGRAVGGVVSTQNVGDQVAVYRRIFDAGSKFGVLESPGLDWGLPLRASPPSGSPVLDGATGKDIVEMVEKLPQGFKRDNIITQISPATYEKMAGRDVAALLKLVYWPGTYITLIEQNPPGVPAVAWKRLEPEDVKILLERWDGDDGNGHFSEEWTKQVIMMRWLEAKPGFNGDGLLDLLSKIPSGLNRDDAIAQIPSATYEKMDGRDVAAVLKLVTCPGTYETGADQSLHNRVPAVVWKRLGPQDVKALLARWDGVNWSGHFNWNGIYTEEETKAIIMRLWMNANSGPPSGPAAAFAGLAAMFALPSPAAAATASMGIVEPVPVTQDLGLGLAIVAIAGLLASVILLVKDSAFNRKGHWGNGLASAFVNAIGVVALVYTSSPGLGMTWLMASLAGLGVLGTFYETATEQGSKPVRIVASLASIGLAVAAASFIFNPAIPVFAFFLALNSLLLAMGILTYR